MRRTSVFKAHDEKNVAKIGDTVRIFKTRTTLEDQALLGLSGKC